ncbi:LptE family protein [Mangrovivirga cuniculi]|uniref:Lipopolysaccharide-assembly n=1 Tax=Mangrovivirga cuniculi TaxID=2715131 RepID=A0A4D7JJR9_9BACT|nr:LptE family protein [Mangrovivirga cuniculi]QCK14957.1 hypothetical protein DCC35_09485 [Mangrovivirga cuniculi]
MKSKHNKYFFLILFFILNACSVNYSFTGISIGPEVKTISISTFFNDTGQGPPTIAQQFTEQLKEYFQRNSNLSIVDYGGDLQLEGSITGYRASLRGVSAGTGNNNIDQAAQERLTITVTATFINTYDESQNFSNRSFSFYEDYDPNTAPLNANEQQYVDNIIEQIILDIFNTSVANW